MYGCSSCGISQHNIPIFFTRYFNNQLPYNKEDVLKKYFPSVDPKPIRILVAPAFGTYSILSSSKMIEFLIHLHKTSQKFHFIFKFHGLCWLLPPQLEGSTELGDLNHPFYSFTNQEKISIHRIRKEFEGHIVAEEDYNILPFMDSVDVLISDLDSSVTFESLYFSSRVSIFAFRTPEQNHPDSEYLSYLTLFQSPEELVQHLDSVYDSSKKPKDGVKFFQQKYGIVDGHEVEKLAKIRKWPLSGSNSSFQPPSEKPSADQYSIMQLSTTIDETINQQVCENTDVANLATAYGMFGIVRGELRAIEDTENFSQFLQLHQTQLQANGVPTKLWKTLHGKLAAELLDGGSVFAFSAPDEEDDSGFGVGKFRLVLKESKLLPNENIYLIDHFWSTQADKASTALRSNELLRKRLSDLMGLEPKEEEEEEAMAEESNEGENEGAQNEEVAKKDELKELLTKNPKTTWQLDLSGRSIVSVESLELKKRYPSLVELSLFDNQISELSDNDLQDLQSLKELKGVWFNNNPIGDDGRLNREAPVSKRLLSACPQLEIINSKFSPSWGAWAVLFAANRHFPSPSKLINDIPRLLAQIYVLDLSGRGISDSDCSSRLSLFEQLTNLRTLDIRDNPNLSWDHVLPLLKALPRLSHLLIDLVPPLDRGMVALGLPVLATLNFTALNPENELVIDLANEPKIQQLHIELWKYLRPYSFVSPKGEQVLVWYLMDEMGTAISHSEEPNSICVPFVYVRPEGLPTITFSLVWPIKEIHEGEKITCDYATGVPSNHRAPFKFVWTKEITATSQEEQNIDAEADQVDDQSIPGVSPCPPPDHPLTCRWIEQLEDHQGQLEDRTRQWKSQKPELSAQWIAYKSKLPLNQITPTSRVLKVYTDSQLVEKNLTAAGWSFTSKLDEADVIWLDSDFKEFSKLSSGSASRPPQFVNQFPNEKCVTYKHHLIETITRVFGQPPWFPESFNLTSDLPLVIADYLRRQQKIDFPDSSTEKPGHLHSSHNLYIIKPWNMARGLEVRVTNNLNTLIRYSHCGIPMVCCHYLEHPLLYYHRKFDLRYIVALKAIHEVTEGGKTTFYPEVYVYKMFWIRIANKKYSLANFDDYEKHFTVMNYSAYRMTQLMYTDFISQMETQHNPPVSPPSTKPLVWKEVQSKINSMIFEIFFAAVQRPPPEGLERDFRARAMYGIDLMVTEDHLPVLLETNFCPDCTRACNYDPAFFNNVFSLMFTEDWRKEQRVVDSWVPCDAFSSE